MLVAFGLLAREPTRRAPAARPLAYVRAPAAVVVRELREAWGPYRIEIDRLPDEERRARILDGTQVLVEVVDAHVEMAFIEVTGGGAPELRLTTDPGGSCCSGVEHWFTRDRGFRPMFEIDRGHGEGFVGARDLDGDGALELQFAITLWADEYIECSSNPDCRLDRAVVVCWDGERATDCTARFPRISRVLAGEALAERNYRDEHRLAGYYGNMVLAGKAARAREWIAAHRGGRAWLAARASAVRTAFTAPVITE